MVQNAYKNTSIETSDSKNYFLPIIKKIFRPPWLRESDVGVKDIEES